MVDRPARVTNPQTVVRPRRPVREVLDQMSGKEIGFFMNNESLKPCCREIMDLEVELLETNPDSPGPDMAKYYCKCGCVHMRAAGGAGRAAKIN